MRTVMAFMVAAAACDGGSTIPVDALTDGKLADAPGDAAHQINGTWLDTYHTVAGPTTMSVCASAPSAIVVDSTTAATTPYPGNCHPDGTFRIMAPGNLGTYYLRVAGALYETTKSAGIDLSTDHLGRNDVAGITGVNLQFTMTGMDAWTPGDVLMAFSSNIGFYQNLAFSAGGPVNTATTLNGTASWYGYKVDSAKADELQVMQLGVHTTTVEGLSYVSLDRSYNVPAVTMANNTPLNLTGAFTTPPSSSLQLAINVASFNQFATVANPNANGRTIAGSAYAAASTDVIPSPSLISFARDATGVTSLNFGTLAHGDPFPASWQRMVKIQEAFAVPYTWNSIAGSLNAVMTRTMTKATAEASIIDANLGPPTAPKFDGVNAFSGANISPVPVVSWSPPTLGSPTDYEIIVYEVRVNGTSLQFISTLRLVSKKTSVRIPAGYLLGQRQYVFVIRARVRQGIDVHTTPLRAGASSASADTLTSLVTTDF